MAENTGLTASDVSAGDDILATQNNNLFTDIKKIRQETLTAGETINGATLPVAIYQNTTDNEIYACDGNDTAKLNFTGFAITNSTNGNDIIIQHTGIVGGFSGLAEGRFYYVQDDKTIGLTPGTYVILVGIAIAPTQLLILPDEKMSEKYELWADDSNLVDSDDSIESVDGTTPTKVKEIQINDVGGTIHTSFYLRFSVDAGYYGMGKIYVNGSPVGAERMANFGGATFTEDIDVEKGDLVQLYLWDSGDLGSSLGSLFRLSYSKRLKVNSGTVN